MSNYTQGPHYLHPRVLHKLWDGLSPSHRQVFNTFLNTHTATQIRTLKQRLRQLSYYQLGLLTARFNATPLRKFVEHLNVTITPDLWVAGTVPWSEISGLGDNCEDVDTNKDEKNPPPTLAPGRIDELPRELFDEVINNACEDAYLPGTVVAAQRLVIQGDDCFADAGFPSGKSIILQHIDAKLYNKYKELYWSENLWVVPKGCYATSFFSLVPDERLLKIRKMRMAFTKADSVTADAFKHYYDPKKSLLGNLDSYDQNYHATVRDLHKAWYDMFYAIAGMKLSTLTLDFRSAFSFEGEFLGLQTARDFVKLDHGLPGNLLIFAPTIRLEMQIYDILAVKNAPEDP